ncbi:alpha beta hydrolase domain-containing protein 11-like [Plasmopara halstedii]|uniref:Alpha beta hydrolase domain-containing protein 11-like n=1 Tax=Plasmopara halstedii TaxID=4781 RepID=A0A0P1A5X4_PLAHL|nr:alpha beta hydrolase domain-containing protein 11-like [Plasmopara halstedii]CEG35582.1 alpha beta hydrolase domain-containing protein 11-like [Plasmopara halstedii]|eukprot:XP_024571951.1 alpha beta hydrolase domain-containing protein 11-like [Plasmopara halstedii]
MYLQQCIQNGCCALPRQVWALDTLPGTGENDFASRDLLDLIETILFVLKKFSGPIRSKAELIKGLQEHGIAFDEAQWLTSNLRRISKSPELYEWKMNADVVKDLFQSFLATDLWPFIEHLDAIKRNDVEIHVVHASNNNMWTPNILHRLDALREKHVYHHLLEKSGHWVHIENPDGLLKIFQSYML